MQILSLCLFPILGGERREEEGEEKKHTWESRGREEEEESESDPDHITDFHLLLVEQTRYRVPQE